MTTTVPALRVLTFACALALVACDVAPSNPPASAPPVVVMDGGGYTGGRIDGALVVVVLDDAGRQPLAGAVVRVGRPDAALACTQITDDSGTVSFGPASCLFLRGPQVVTVSAYGFVPATWFGVDGASVTVPLQARAGQTVPHAVAAGTIDGWPDLRPAQGHALAATVIASQRPRLEGSSGVASMGATIAAPSQLCVAEDAGSDCHWELETRPGKQALAARLVDVDTRGTDDVADDASKVVGWGLARGTTLGEGERREDQRLAVSPSSSWGSLVARTPSPLAPLDGFSAVEVTPLLDLGEEGLLGLSGAEPDVDVATVAVPPLGVEPWAGAALVLAAEARPTALRDAPASTVWWRGDATSSPTLPAWLPPPAALSVVAGDYAFAPPAGANLVSAMIADAAGAAWNVMIFDGARTFTLPALVPSPLPGGALTFTVTAWDIPAFDPSSSVSFDDLARRMIRRARDRVSFRR